MLPDMRRWTTQARPSSRSTIKYLPRRRSPAMRRPFSSRQNSDAGTSCTRRGASAATRQSTIVRPTTRRSRSRRTVSTSGSSGIAPSIRSAARRAKHLRCAHRMAARYAHAVTAAASGDDSDYRALHAAAFLALFCVGLYASAFGPALPFIADDTDVSLDTGGMVLTTFFIGSITASAAVALVLHVKSSRVLGAAGLAGASTGALMLGFAPVWWLAIGGGLIMGLGDGLIIAGLHILMARTSRDVPAAINNLNLWF